MLCPAPLCSALPSPALASDMHCLTLAFVRAFAENPRERGSVGLHVESDGDQSDGDRLSQMDSPDSQARLHDMITDAVRSVRDRVEALKQQRERSLANLPAVPAWASKDLRRHEAHWMRKELANVMQGVGLTAMPSGDYSLGRFTIVLRRPLERRRDGAPGAGLLEMPNLYDYLVDKRKLHIINFATYNATRLLQEAGMGTVPCDNPACNGLGNGAWDTVPLQWSCETSAPQITIDELGMPAPTICMRSRCRTCGLPFHHTGAVTLARMRDVPALRADLPYDPEWRFGDVALSRVFTSACETDVISRQGLTMILSKVDMLGTQTVHNICEVYLAAGQIAYNQLYQRVNEKMWAAYTLQQQLQLAPLRGEFVALEEMDDRITPLGKGGGRRDLARFGFLTLVSNSFAPAVLEVFERRHDLRMRQMCQVGCDYVCSLDFCAHSGKVLGGKWQLLVTNEENNLIGSLVSDNVKLGDSKPFLTTLAKRPNFKARVAIIDNVPPSLDPTALSTLEVMLMETLGVEWVGQDRFHVAHSFSPKFNNCHPGWWELIILGWRHATVERDVQCERLVIERLRTGTIKKQCTFRDVKYEICGNQWRRGVNAVWLSLTDNFDAWLSDAQSSGLFHELFSTSPNVIVPENVLKKDALSLSIDRYIEGAIEQIFLPQSEGGVRQLRRTHGKALAQCDEAAVRQIFTNAKKRMMKCVPPDHLDAWRRTDKTDQNDIAIWKPYFHSCGTENWNSQQMSFVVGANTKKENATALFYEGNARLITNKEVEAGRQEDIDHSNPTVPLRCNAWAGHGGGVGGADGQQPHRLLQSAPFFVSLPPPAAEDEVCVQPIGRFDEGSRRKTPPALRLQFAPTTVPRAPQSAALQLSTSLSSIPHLSSIGEAPASAPAPAPAPRLVAASPAASIAASPAASVAASIAASPAASIAASPAASPAAPPRAAALSANAAAASLATDDENDEAFEQAPKKRRYSKARERVAGRSSKKNPWRGACMCMPQAVLNAPGGRTHHKSYCPVEQWLVDASVGEPADKEECVATADAIGRIGERRVYCAVRKKWEIVA